MSAYRYRCNENLPFTLDLAEAILERYGYDKGQAMKLEELLTAANSLYRVNNTRNGLEERVAGGVKEVVREAVDTSGNSAGDHLISAWNEAYGRNVDAVKSYSESIKAVESAFAPRISPQNGKQSLGTMIRDVSAKPTKWTFALSYGGVDGVETLVQMMRTLWSGQRSRHGGPAPTSAETLDEARAALHLAAALVEFGSSGAFRVA